MQAQHIVILVGIGVCYLLLAVFIERAFKRTLCMSCWAEKDVGASKSSVRMDAL